MSVVQIVKTDNTPGSLREHCTAHDTVTVIVYGHNKFLPAPVGFQEQKVIKCTAKRLTTNSAVYDAVSGFPVTKKGRKVYNKEGFYPARELSYLVHPNQELVRALVQVIEHVPGEPEGAVMERFKAFTAKHPQFIKSVYDTTHWFI